MNPTQLRSSANLNDLQEQLSYISKRSVEKDIFSVQKLRPKTSKVRVEERSEESRLTRHNLERLSSAGPSKAIVEREL
jgi:hypothetical protein